MDSCALLTRLYRLGAIAAWGGALVWMAGCSSGYAPVSDRSLGGTAANHRSAPVAKRSQVVPSSYRVAQGDTLYSIAWRYGKDYRQLARINGIGSDYRIYPGQRLRLSGSPIKTASVKPAARPSPPPVPETNASNRPPSGRVQQAPKPEPAVAQKSIGSKKLTWRWPVAGNLVGRFSPSGTMNKGIDIAAVQGDPVFAAATGRVVYAGSGLLGYGNLIIINHNEEYLSAYAHNRKLLVKEQDLVKAGDKIAEVGKSGTTRAMLHFEIRRDGKPVNPLRYLPKR